MQELIITMCKPVTLSPLFSLTTPLFPETSLPTSSLFDNTTPLRNLIWLECSLALFPRQRDDRSLAPLLPPQTTTATTTKESL